MVPSFNFFEADLELLAPNKINSSSGGKSVEVCAHRVSTNAPITLKFCKHVRLARPEVLGGKKQIRADFESLSQFQVYCSDFCTPPQIFF